MITPVLLTKKDCYCSLTSFYENVARKLEVNVTEETRYDCRKICVTKPVQEALWSFYQKKMGQSDEWIATMMLQYGPKANLKEDGTSSYRAKVEDGFARDEEEEISDGC